MGHKRNNIYHRRNEKKQSRKKITKEEIKKSEITTNLLMKKKIIFFISGKITLKWAFYMPCEKSKFPSFKIRFGVFLPEPLFSTFKITEELKGALEI